MRKKIMKNEIIVKEVSTIGELYEIEPVLYAIIELTASHEGLDKWEKYSYGKELASEYVGFGAEKEELRTEKAYNIFIKALCERLVL